MFSPLFMITILGSIIDIRFLGILSTFNLKIKALALSLLRPPVIKLKALGLLF